MGSFAISQAQLAALFMQSVAFGIHIITFAACIYSWFCRSTNTPTGTQGSARWMVIAIALFVIGACDVSFNFYHNLIAFVEYKGPGGPNAAFNNASNWVNVIRVSSEIIVVYEFRSDASYGQERLVVCRCNSF